MFCAGINGQVGSGAGDRGGPVVIKYPEGFYVIGIVSFGAPNAVPGFPTVYVNVLQYAYWIPEVIASLEEK